MEIKFEERCGDILDLYLSCPPKNGMTKAVACKNILDEYNKCVTKKFKQKIIENSEYDTKEVNPIKYKKIRNSTIPGTKKEAQFSKKNQDLLFLYFIKPYSS